MDAYNALKDSVLLIQKWKKKNDKDKYILELEEKLQDIAIMYDDIANKYQELASTKELQLTDLHVKILELIYENEKKMNDIQLEGICYSDKSNDCKNIETEIAIEELKQKKYILCDFYGKSDFFYDEDGDVVKNYIWNINERKIVDILKAIKTRRESTK